MSKPIPIDVYYYVNDHTDEVLPCSARLDSWAEWLSKPDEDWDHAIPTDGETFSVSSMQVLGNLQIEMTDDGFDVPDLPEGTGQVFVRVGGPESGWNADDSTAFALSATHKEKIRAVRDLLAGFWLTDTGDAVCIACCGDGPNYLATYRAGPPPALTLGATIQ